MSSTPLELGRCCIVVPAYQEAGRIHAVVQDILNYCPNVVVIDDGCDDGTGDEAERAGAHVIRHDGNKGKGVALNTGFAYAREHGYEVAITMDADGQHAPSDIAGFLSAYSRTRIPVLIGNRMAECDDMPVVRRMTNRYMSWLLSRKIGQYVPDTQCGFRLYRMDLIPQVSADTAGFAAESEILMRLARRGIRIDSVPIQVIYGDEKSKINPLRDTWRFFSMLRRFSRKQSRG